jgi:hypothetical protein
MTLDPTTGIFTLDSGTTLGPALTRAAFLASPEGQAAERWGLKAYRFFTRQGTMVMVVYFGPAAKVEHDAADTLFRVDFGSTGPGFSTSWDNWTPEEDLRRKAIDEEWLTGQGIQLLPAANDQRLATYPWGSVGSYYDFKNGTWGTALSFAGWR